MHSLTQRLLPPPFRWLSPNPRKFLTFALLNSVAWQTLVGSVLVLHARALGIPAQWVGVLMSIVPFTMLLTLPGASLVERLGPKRLMARGWIIRYVVAIPIALTPVAMRSWGRETTVVMLFAAVFGFCLCRGVAAVGWFPWVQELTPPQERGRYFSAELMTFQFVSLAVGLLGYFVLGARNDPTAFGWICGIGLAFGFGSIPLLFRIPGGLPHPEIRRRRLRIEVGLILRDRPFVRFARWTVLGYFVVFGLGPLLTLYLRDYLGMPPARIMLLTGMTGVAVLVVCPWWGRIADIHGTSLVQMLAGLWASAALLLLAVQRPGAEFVLVAAAFILSAVGAAGFSIASRRGAMKRMRVRLRASFTAVWVTATSFAAGTSCILVGQLLKHASATAYVGSCVAYALLFALAAGACGRLPEEESVRFRAGLRVRYQSTRPLWSLVGSLWFVLAPPDEATAPPGDGEDPAHSDPAPRGKEPGKHGKRRR